MCEVIVYILMVTLMNFKMNFNSVKVHVHVDFFFKILSSNISNESAHKGHYKNRFSKINNSKHYKLLTIYFKHFKQKFHAHDKDINIYVLLSFSTINIIHIYEILKFLHYS